MGLQEGKGCLNGGCKLPDAGALVSYGPAEAEDEVPRIDGELP